MNPCSSPSENLYEQTGGRHLVQVGKRSISRCIFEALLFIDGMFPDISSGIPSFTYLLASRHFFPLFFYPCPFPVPFLAHVSLSTTWRGNGKM